MKFDLDKSLEVLEKTPAVLFTMLRHLSSDWTEHHEGGDAWSVKEVIAHLIICEKTNWIVRTKIILSDDAGKTFSPIDMTTHFGLAQSKSLEKLLEEFSLIRENNLSTLKNYKLKEADLLRTAIHLKLGEVNLQQLIATWVTHDLSHTAQIARIMAKQCKEQVGPFDVYLNILNS